MSAPSPVPLPRKIARAAIALLLASMLCVWGFLFFCTTLPGESRDAPLPALDTKGARTRDHLRASVEMLATTIGPRNDEHPEAYERAADFIEKELKGMGHDVARHDVETARGTWPNLEVTISGSSERVVLMAAHYDSCHTTPGADDNASGVAALLEIARALHGSAPAHTIRLVFVANEEPPHFQRTSMGSVVYAKMARERGDDIAVMYALEMLGYFTDEPGSQHYPPLLSSFYPGTGDFLALATTLEHRDVAEESMRVLRDHAALPTEGFTGPSSTPGIDYSDPWSFWQAGYPAILVTDTSFFRTPHYHQPTDTPETLDYHRLTLVTHALIGLALDYPASL